MSISSDSHEKKNAHNPSKWCHRNCEIDYTFCELSNSCVSLVNTFVTDSFSIVCLANHILLKVLQCVYLRSSWSIWYIYPVNIKWNTDGFKMFDTSFTRRANAQMTHIPVQKMYQSCPLNIKPVTQSILWLILLMCVATMHRLNYSGQKSF